jgi:hypothetical protein
MGMGLTISQTILENHEGRIWAESAPGHGTVFHVALPLAPLSAWVAPPSTRTEPALAAKVPGATPTGVTR